MAISVSGKRFDLSKEDVRFEKVLDLIREKGDYEITDAEMMQVIDPVAVFNAEEGVELKNGIVHVEGEALPSELSLRVIDLKKQNIPIKNLLKFWLNLKNNPSMNSVQQLYKFLEHNGHPITSDGCFIAYRSIRDDFKDFHTGTMDNSVGQTVELPRNKVNDKPEETCSNGLHVASWEYAKNFGSGGRRMVEVKVDPKDVVCVPNDYNNTKMRVCKFVVLSEVESERRESFVNLSPSDDFDSEEDEDCYDHECESCNSYDCQCDEQGYTDEDKDEVLALKGDHEDEYEGKALVARISEDCILDKETIQKILDDHK